jgi:uncharacterized RDD family membrane protein YckC
VTFEDNWQQKSDRELDRAGRELNHYTEPAQQAIRNELWRRGRLESQNFSSVVRQDYWDRDVEYAGFWSRFCAAMIDGIIFRLIGSIFTHALSIGNEKGLSGWDVIETLCYWFYYAGLESSEHQGTLGKQVMGIVVTDMEGNRISFGRATGRHFGRFLSAITFLVGYIMMSFNDKRQTLHDCLAGTLVQVNRRASIDR